MDRSRRWVVWSGVVCLLAGMSTPVFGFPPPGRGRGPRRDEAWEMDHAVLEKLLEGREHIRRKVTDLPNGVRTVTETDDPKLRARLREHVAAMKKRVESGNPIHRRDPLFDAVFRNAAKIEMTVERTEKGVQVTETSDDPYVAKLVQAHARVVSLFLKNGHTEARRNHELPER